MIRPTKITKGKPKRKGGSVLEAALIVPILVSLGFGMAEFSYFFFVKHTLEGSAREAARNAIVPNATYTGAVTAANNSTTAAGISTALTSVAFKDLTTGATLTSANFGTATSPGDAIQVTVTGTWSSIGVHPMNIIPGTKQVQGTCVMRKEG
ncbi:MAG: pilus assembly protein [Phycisphaerae bacterium]|nr:pilus assembly protein [Phycisphaerae bacterium]